MDRLTTTIKWLYSLEARGEIYKLERMEAALDLMEAASQATHRPYRGHQGERFRRRDATTACLRAASYRTGLLSNPIW